MADDIDGGFDMAAGVADIADSMGFGATDDEHGEFDQDESGDIDNEEGDTGNTDNADKDTALEPEVSVKAAPASWAKDQHEVWSKLPPEAQAQIELREKQMLDGIEQYKHGHQIASEMQKIIEPYRNMITSTGLNETQAINNLLAHNQALTQGPVETRQQRFIELGQSLGLIPIDGQDQIGPRTQELQQRLERLEQQEQQQKEQVNRQNYERVSQEVSAFFADPKNEYAEELTDDIATLLKAGFDLASAYDKAVWANPITRAKETSKTLEAQTKELARKNTEAAAAARKASSTNIRAKNTNKTSADPTGSWDDTMSDTLAAIKGR